MRDSPNILWLTYEDTSPQFVSCYGQTPVVTTSNMDALAEDGVRFDNVYATAPVCSASRSSLITGVANEATGLGHHRSKYPIPRGFIKGFPLYMQKAGYYTTNNRKTDYNIVNERDFIDETWHESSSQAHWRNRENGQPFFSVFNFDDSHQSRTMTTPWGWYEEHVLNQLPDDEIISPEDIAMPPIYRDTDEMRKHLSRVYNSLRLCDIRIKKKIDELEADGLLEDTIIFCFADHGEGIPRGKCNGIGFGYRASFVAWFPEKFKDLSPWGTGVVTDELISFEDLAPSMLSLAGVDVPEHMTGRVLLGEQREQPRSYIFAARNRLDDTPDLCRSVMDGRFVYTRNYFPHLPVVKYQKYSDVGDILRAIRRDYADGLLDDVQAELVKPTRPCEYLYDISSDQWEVNNLADDEQYRGDLERLRNAAIEHMHDVHDVMFLPERDMVLRAGDSSPYEKRADGEYNPLDEMLAAADLIGNPDAVSQQIDFLNHKDDVVRYWAAVGLFAMRNSLECSHIDAIRPHLSDEAESVQIELAACLVDACGDEEAKSILAKHVENDDNLLAHQAVTKVLYMPKKAIEFSASMTRSKASLADRDEVNVFPVSQAIDMYFYLYEGAPLYYDGEEKYFNLAERTYLYR
ncbi:MAG: sulfatase-like hydrolase/transferase [Kiritimatiellae bacterium]|jgi:arylsulfatase A-like enzyme|nr:sulfatase-like hydrolase/transferase [Kiritimatiellia bacterium]